MKRRRVRGIGLVGLLLVLGGCGRYEIVFQVEDVINDGGKGDAAKEQLDVNIVCVTKEDARALPALADGTLWSKEWFEARDRQEQSFRRLDGRVYALRAGERGPHDKLVGPPLVSGRSLRSDAERDRVVQVAHPNWLAADSALVIFGRFHDGAGGLKNTRPIVIRPLPAWDKQIVVGVGRTELTLLGIR